MSLCSVLGSSRLDLRSAAVTIIGRTVSSGGGAPFRTVPKSLSLDFGGLGSTPSALSPQGPPLVSQDRYAAVSQLDKALSDTIPTTGKVVPYVCFLCVFLCDSNIIMLLFFKCALRCLYDG